MFAIMGITGQVGGVVARTLLAAGQPVRAIARDAAKGRAWADRGCELALASIENVAALTSAFSGADGVFILAPPNFDPTPDFPEACAIAAALRTALDAARPACVVYLSTIGAQATQSNLLTQHTIIEQALGELPMPITFLRPAWFMENCRWDVAPARESGVIPSFLQPLDKAVPMVATADIGRVAAGLLREGWSGRRVVELEGPHRVTPNEIAAVFTRLVGRPVRMEAVPRESWEDLFRSQGVKNPMPRIRMLDGFNEGWIDFEGGEAQASQKGTVALESVLKALLEEKAHAP
jgi:NAD(P)H dehydrogenase (quinone)